nr:hypothetical protein [uncultured Sphaerochaeta sp.]
MKERLYDLNGRENCMTAAIKVSDKTFRISRVVTGVRLMYANHLKQMGEMLRTISTIDVSTPEGIARAAEQEAAVDQFMLDKKQAYEDILTLLLTKNGYEYDKAWWESNTDEFDIRSFIEACLSKDAGEQKKK